MGSQLSDGQQKNQSEGQQQNQSEGRQHNQTLLWKSSLRTIRREPQGGESHPDNAKRGELQRGKGVGREVGQKPCGDGRELGQQLDVVGGLLDEAVERDEGCKGLRIRRKEERGREGTSGIRVSRQLMMLMV